MRWLVLVLLALFSSVTHGQDLTTLSSTTLPETTLPSTTLPSTTLPETTLPETTLPETTLPETTLPSTTLPSVTQGGYCSVCENHTMCLYPNDGPGPKCINYTEHFFTSGEKIAILAQHNEFRQMIARGDVPNFPAALDMVDLQWNDEDALIARRLALTCHVGHDTCRNHIDGLYAGQNLFAAWTPDDGGFINYSQYGVKAWFDEYKLYTPDVKNLLPKWAILKKVGHFTQLVWSRTTHVGCERSYYNNDEYFVCNYSPGGNVQNGVVYKPLWLPTKSKSSSAVRHGGCFLTLSVTLVLALSSYDYNGRM